MRDYRARGITYDLQDEDRLPDTSDCSAYVADVMRHAALPVPLVCTWELHESLWYMPIASRVARSGDVVWQPGHMGIYLGESVVRRGSIAYKAYDFASRGPRRPVGLWGPGGTHVGGEDAQFYRPCLPQGRRASPAMTKLAGESSRSKTRANPAARAKRR